MAYTISTHNGSQYVRAHNIRDRRLTNKEPHIDAYGIYEIWKDEKVRDAYERIFGDAVKAYNTRQTREERKIKDYYSRIQNDEKKHAVYEMIVAIGNKDNEPDSKTGRAILREFYEDWAKRNPSLELIGAYYHADEAGVPHIHLDYVPVGEGYTRGLNVQNGLNRALEQQGFTSISPKNTAQMQWEKRENLALERICQEHGLEIIHPEVEGRTHLEKDQFIRFQEHARTIAHLLQAVSEDRQRIEPMEVIEERKRLFGDSEPKKAVFKYDDIMPVLEHIPKYEAVIDLAKQLDKATNRVVQSNVLFLERLNHAFERLDDTLVQERQLRKEREAYLQKLKHKLASAENKLRRYDILKERYPDAFKVLEMAIQAAKEQEFQVHVSDYSHDAPVYECDEHEL